MQNLGLDVLGFYTSVSEENSIDLPFNLLIGYIDYMEYFLENRATINLRDFERKQSGEIS